jgi:hypothetical protein
MARFAPGAPIQVLEQMYEHDPKVFGEYHLLLAHHTVEYVERFRKLFNRIAADGVIHPMVIMDNSVVECGGYVDFNMMQEAVAAVQEAGHDVIPVLPDVMGKGQETREATLEAYGHWEKNIPCAGFMAVCQGEDWSDYTSSVALFSNRGRFPLMEYLGVPRILVGKFGSRLRATRFALRYAEGSDIQVHLLGYSDDTLDDFICSSIEGVQGIDSAVPLRVPTRFRFGEEDGKRPADWFEKAQMTPLLLENLNYVRGVHDRQVNR